ncbi:MAG: hypothetical protein FRX48_03913 [Lasallia pustulata]|uniref:DUF7730 domain-containing protein n=1 Tax=Lasallia pustulata TaxID=136370 RepID=A0A5M8PTQ6_9LECA|nr:MAG: hypothetical protein FRX48_03913 [Lasallia pustulata]
MQALGSRLSDTTISDLPKPKLGFHSIPPELRLEVYRHVFHDPGRCGTRSSHRNLQAQFLRTSRLVYHEGAPLLYSLNAFSMSIHPEMITYPGSPHLRRHSALSALARNWSLTIHLLDREQETWAAPEDHHADVIVSTPRLKSHLRNIAFALSAPQSYLEIHIPHPLTHHRALWHPSTGLLEPLKDIHARDCASHFCVMRGSDASERAADEISRYMITSDDTIMRKEAFNLSAQLLREAKTYARAFFATPSDRVSSAIWTAPGALRDIPQAMDLDELIEQRVVCDEPCAEWLWEEAVRLDYRAEVRARLQVALGVLERRFKIIEQARRRMSWRQGPKVHTVVDTVRWMRAYAWTAFRGFVARTDALDRFFGLIAYLETFQEPMGARSKKWTESFDLEWEARMRMAYEDRVKTFLPALLVQQLRVSYDDVLQGRLSVEELMDAVEDVKGWCEVQFAVMTDAREYFYLRPLLRQWMGELAPNMDWKDEVC